VLVQSKLGVREDANAFEGKTTAKLKLGLFSYPVLQAADILVHRLAFRVEEERVGGKGRIG